MLYGGDGSDTFSHYTEIPQAAWDGLRGKDCQPSAGNAQI